MAKWRITDLQQKIPSWFIFYVTFSASIFAQTTDNPENILQNDSISVNWENFSSLLHIPHSITYNTKSDSDQIMRCKGPEKGCFSEKNEWLEIVYKAKNIKEDTTERTPLNHISRADDRNSMACRNRYNDVGTCVQSATCQESKGVEIGKCFMSNAFKQVELGVCCLNLPCSIPVVNVNSRNEREPVSYANEKIDALLRLGLSHSKQLRSFLSPNFEIKSDSIIDVAVKMEQCGATGREIPFSKMNGVNTARSSFDIHDENHELTRQEIPEIQSSPTPSINRIDPPIRRLNEHAREMRPIIVPQQSIANAPQHFSENRPQQFTPSNSLRIPFQSESEKIVTLRPRLQQFPFITPGTEQTQFVHPSGHQSNFRIVSGLVHGQSQNIGIHQNPMLQQTNAPSLNRHHGFSLGHTTFNQRRIPKNPHIFIPNHRRFDNRVLDRQRRETDSFYEERLRESHIFATEEQLVTEVDIASHNPWMLALWIRTPTGDNIPTCGAALISSQYAITAAHCVNGDHGFEYFLRGGSNINVLPSVKLLLESLRSSHKTRFGNEGNAVPSGVEDDKIGGIRIDIENILMHPQFNPFTFEHDIALIKFTEPVKTKRDLFPICLPPPIVDDEITDYAGEFATVAGWGCRTEDCAVSAIPTVLQEIEIPIIPNELAMCWFYKDSHKMGREEYIPSQLFVVGGDESASTATCKGDSGSPVVRLKPDSQNTWEIIGLVSWSKGCGRQFRPSVWTRVENFVNWIKSNMDEEDDLA